ncbi:MAG: cytochrome c-type biogenesis protein CcmH [Rhodospirillales bacterium]|nr:cytochrome c-type biogenesis protein CcmH [Rhodospirillales bacterium]
MGAFLLLLLLAVPAVAVTPQERLADPALEARAREISQELRCLVCQNQSIDDSDADLAHDLRIIVRERLKAGDTNEQVIDWIVARYGDFVLLRPPVKPVTWPMWFAPAVVLALGAIAVAVYFRRRRARPEPTAPLSPEERRRLESLLDG